MPPSYFVLLNLNQMSYDSFVKYESDYMFLGRPPPLTILGFAPPPISFS